VSDFASAAMVRVLVQGMRELGLQPPAEAAQVAAEGARGATVHLALKRSLVASAVAQGGLACLPLLGRGLRRHRHDPTHRALASARSVDDLFARWQRLERYIHSRHRCEVVDLRPGRARLRHVPRAGTTPPLPAEDLVVLGLLAALLEELGLDGVRAHAGGVVAYPRADAAGLARAAAAAATAEWELAWRGEVGAQSGLRNQRRAGAAATVGAAGNADAAGATGATAVAGVTGATDPAVAATTTGPPGEAGTAGTAGTAWHPAADELVEFADWPSPLADCARLLLDDLMHPLPLPALAAALDWAPRSLQRALARTGLGYAPLLAELRCRAAACWLLRSTAPIAEVGFVCGYADQPHFTRELCRRVGMTPARYREAFAEAGGRRRSRAGAGAPG
jgi:AraC-like DNA-binding protein